MSTHSLNAHNGTTRFSQEITSMSQRPYPRMPLQETGRFRMVVKKLITSKMKVHKKAKNK